MLMVVLEGQKRIEAGATVSVLDRDHAIFLRRGHYGMAATLSQETGAYRCAIFFFDDAFLGEFAHQHSLLPDGRIAADPASPLALPVRVSPLLRASIESVLPYFTHAGANRPRILRLKLQEILLNLLDADPESGLARFLLPHRLRQARPRAPRRGTPRPARHDRDAGAHGRHERLGVQARVSGRVRRVARNG